MLTLLLLLGRVAASAGAAYCYRPSSVVCLSVGRSVCRSVTVLSPAKTDEPIEIPFGLWGLGWDRQPCVRRGSRSP